MLLRFISFLKIIDDEFSEIINDAELYADRIRLILVSLMSWVDVRYPVEGKFSFTGKGKQQFTESTRHHITEN